MPSSSDSVLVHPDELKAVAAAAEAQVKPTTSGVELADCQGESVAWYKALGRLKLPEAEVHVELLSGLPILATRRPVGAEIYNDQLGGATDFFRCLRLPSLHEQFLGLHYRFGGIDLNPRKLARLCRSHDSRLMRAYCWFRLALGLFQHRRTDRGLWQDRPQQFDVLDINDEWADALYNVLTNIGPDLPGLHGRLALVQFEENPWEKIIKLYDAPDTLFWIDAQPGLVEQQSITSPTALVDRLADLKGSFAVLWWKQKIPKGLQRWEKQPIPGTSLTLLSRQA